MSIRFWPDVRKRAYLGLSLAASVAVPVLLFAVHAVQGHKATLADMEDRLARRAAILAEHTARVFGTYDMVFDSVEHMLRDGVGEPERSRRLAELTSRTGSTSSLLVIDSAGVVVGSSNGLRGIGMVSSDREYFSAAVTNPGKVVSPPFVGRLSKRNLFALSRRAGDGHVLAALVFAGYFETVFGTMAGQEAGLQGVVTLYRDDGVQLVRYPSLERPVNLPPGSPGLMREIPKERGFYRVERPLAGGPERAYAFHRVPGHPAYVTFGVEVDEVTASWRQETVVSGLLAAAAAALLVAFALFAAHRMAQSHRTETELQRAVAARGVEVVAAIRDREAALRMAERAHNAKAHFLAAASHDLRQPIQALRLFLEVLGARLNGTENLRILGHASKALKGAEDLLSALLDVSTLDAGMVAPDKRRLPLAEVLGGLAAEFATQANARSLDFRYVPTSAWVESDPVLLSRLLRNLLTNALRYTEDGRVLLGCRKVGGDVRVEVWDTGPGIPADKLETVFEDFVQLGNPERDRAKGLGLGLAVVRRMAVLLRHPVELRSWEGRGTVFSIRLPRCAPREAEGGIASVTVASPA